METFAEKYGTKYGKAVACLTKDRDALLGFYDFPAEHWDHLRTANPIESVFATVRHHRPHQGRPLAEDGEADGLHPCPRRREEMAPAERRKPVASRRRRHHIHRRCRSPRPRNPRRLIRSRHPDSAIALDTTAARTSKCEVDDGPAHPGTEHLTLLHEALPQDTMQDLPCRSARHLRVRDERRRSRQLVTCEVLAGEGQKVVGICPPPSFGTTIACTASPQTRCGTPTIATSLT